MSDIVIPSPSAFLSSPVQPSRSSPPPPPRQKKRAHRKSDSVQKPVDPTRPKQTKSRNGCQTCKLKRLKCDESKPTCTNCAKRGVECGGYVQKYKWRPFDEQNVTFKLDTPASISFTKRTPKPPNHTNTASISTSPPEIDPALLHDSHAVQQSSHEAETPLQPNDTSPQIQNSRKPRDPDAGNSKLEGDQDQDQHAFGLNMTSRHLSLSDIPQELHDAAFDNLSLEWEPPPGFDMDGCEGLEALATMADMTSHSLPARLDFFGSGFDYLGNDDDEDDNIFGSAIEQAPGTGDDVLDTMDWDLDQPDDAHNSPPSMQQILSLLPRHPQLSSDSPEMLMKRFDRFTCGIMSIRDGPNENPWRKLIWPLMHDNPIVFDAVASMACFQGSRNEPELRTKGVFYADRVLAALKTDSDNIRTDVALASTLCLAFGESWDCTMTARTGIDYIRVCKKLVKGALRQGRKAYTDAESQKRLKFLCKTWIYIDVIARLTSVDEDISNDFELVTNLINGPLDPETEIDPLMGCGSTLFPIIGRVANLVRRVCKVEENSLDIVQEASRLQQLLTRWKTPGEYTKPEDPTTTVAHALQTAEAYRWATLLYLHQAVPELSSASSSELAKKTMLALATVPLTSRTVVVQIYPLLAAGCEAMGADRTFVAERWNSMSLRMGIGNIDRCADVVKEVWRRRDTYAAQKSAITSPLATPLPPTLRSPFATDGMDLEGFPHWAEPFHGPLSRSMSSSSGVRPRMPRVDLSLPDTCPLSGMMDVEFSVRGSLHWVAVMKSFHWEVLLG